MFVDECATGAADCDVNATCTDLATSFQCTCNPGYEGSGTLCTDVDECADGTAGCDPVATCANDDGFTCTCPSGDIATSCVGAENTAGVQVHGRLTRALVGARVRNVEARRSDT